MKIQSRDIKENDDNFKFISDGTWYTKGTECLLLANCAHCGLFRGLTRF